MAFFIKNFWTIDIKWLGTLKQETIDNVKWGTENGLALILIILKTFSIFFLFKVGQDVEMDKKN